MAMVLVTAVIFSIAAFGALTMAVSRARQANYVSEDRIRARYAAEAGLVWAMQQLWANPATFPNVCCNAGCAGTKQSASWPIDTDGGGPLPATNVDVAVDNCGPDRLHTLSAKVTF